MNPFIALIVVVAIAGSLAAVSMTSKVATPAPNPAPAVSPGRPETASSATTSTTNLLSQSQTAPGKTATPNPPILGEAPGSAGEFAYPSATRVSGEGSSFTLKSGDSPATITDWYKNRIKQAGMKTTSFVQTSTNGNILNSLVGAGNGHEVRVEIKKSADEGSVTINVSQKQQL